MKPAQLGCHATRAGKPHDLKTRMIIEQTGERVTHIRVVVGYHNRGQDRVVHESAPLSTYRKYRTSSRLASRTSTHAPTVTPIGWPHPDTDTSFTG